MATGMIATTFLDGFGESAQPQVPKPRGGFERFVTEHVLEAQLLQAFMEYVEKSIDSQGAAKIDGQDIPSWDYIAQGYPGDSNHASEIVEIIESVNIAKENAFKGNNPKPWPATKKFLENEATVGGALRNMKIVIMAYKYLKLDIIQISLKNQATRVADRMETVEDAMAKA
ncbi:hypothetical protein QQS21_012271 [Conoideocrella luteorostrata]|uniref:Uncharacterized protein n=1 Tax=Conoideocrella luteorostrata TaxID=1105319 RepID=A0AAJ0CDU3_9HYPO|nr:hypothetical protein QQS21_012271 [Conoideocrella luteorostrata]